jgi:uncharacterized protein (DUF433 family)
MVVESDLHLESSATVRGGRPTIVGTRISVDDVVIMYVHLGQQVEEIAGKYNLSPAAVHAALTYYYDHKSAVDELIAADDALVEAFKRDNPSKLQEKLRAIGRG